MEQKIKSFNILCWGFTINCQQQYVVHRRHSKNICWKKEKKGEKKKKVPEGGDR